MAINIVLLFLSGFSGAYLLYRKTDRLQDNFKLAIAFAGGFLLSISVLHILPDLFQSSLGQFKAGLLILAGFFLQQFLEYFSDGAEHGHFHSHQKDHNHSSSFGILILLGLSIHSFLEGSVLSVPEKLELTTSTRNLLTGIIIHKVPASLALTSILVCSPIKKSSALAYILIFAFASPVGLLVGNYLSSPLGSTILLGLLAIVCGNFLHISTTIVFEGSPGHKFNFQRLLWSLMGVGVAIITELLN